MRACVCVFRTAKSVIEMPKTPLFDKLSASIRRPTEERDSDSDGDRDGGFHFGRDAIRAAVGTAKALSAYRTPSKQREPPSMNLQDIADRAAASAEKLGRARSVSPQPPRSGASVRPR